MSSTSAELLLDCHCQLGESPTWDERVQRLYFVDINSKKIYILDPATKEASTIDAPLMVSAVILTEDQDVLIATLHRTVVLVDLRTRAIGKPIAMTPEEHGIEEMRFNDGKAGPSGELVLGRMHLSMKPENPGRLYSLDPKAGTDAQLQTLLPEVGLPNGMGWDTSKRVMWFNDTLAHTVTAYATDEHGTLLRAGKGLKQVSQFTVEEGSPDGMCLDGQGNIWLALADTDFVGQYDQKGKLLHKVTLPVQGPTACTFGGEHLDQLYITTMAQNGEARPHGGLYVARVPGVVGISPAHRANISNIHT